MKIDCDCVDGQELQGEDPGDGRGTRAAQQPPADQRPGDLHVVVSGFLQASK